MATYSIQLKCLPNINRLTACVVVNSGVEVCQMDHGRMMCPSSKFESTVLCVLSSVQHSLSPRSLFEPIDSNQLNDLVKLYAKIWRALSPICSSKVPILVL